MKRLLAVGALALGLSACAPATVEVAHRTTYPGYVYDEDPSVVVVDQGPYAYRYRYHRTHHHTYIGH